MYVMPDASPIARRLVKTTYQAMWEGIKEVKPGATLGDIGHAIQSFAQSHGIGREMHEAPQVLHYGIRGQGVVLKEGMTFTIEPMINQGGHKIKTKKRWLDCSHP